MLMKPGPATLAEATSSSFDNSATSASASTRGLVLAGLARTIAALVARSPWLVSRGGSTVTFLRSSPAGSVPAAVRVSSAASMCAAKRV
ncbi:hypothetical protein QFZ54_000263 [Sphingomonas faeni]|nr:hypothetical protein [Sphingomonas faeni]